MARKKKLPKRKSAGPRRAPWYKALEKPILETCIKPLIEVASKKGFASKADLRKNFEAIYKCAVSQDVFDNWLHALGLYDVVAGTRLRTLDGSTPLQPVAHLNGGISPVKDAPGQLGLGGEEISPSNPDGFNSAEADEVDLENRPPSQGKLLPELVLALSPSQASGPSATNMGVFGAPAGTLAETIGPGEAAALKV